MVQKIFAVVGATGIQGGSVARIYLQEPGWNVRALTRDPSKPSAKPLRDAGAELVAADLDDPASLRRAFQGVSAVFAVTDFWQFMSNPGTAADAEKKGISMNEVAMQREIAQGKNLVDVVAETESVERFIFSTLSDSRKWSNGEITENYHFDGKAVVEVYLKETYPKLAAKSSYVHVGAYMDNHKRAVSWGPQKQSDGTFKLSHYSANPERPYPWVWPPTDTGVFVRALMNAPPGKSLLGESDPMTSKEWATLWGKINGVQCTFEPASAEEQRAVCPPLLAGEMLASAIYVSKYGWAGGDPEVITPAQLGIKPDELMSAEEYIKNENWSAILNP